MEQIDLILSGVTLAFTWKNILALMGGTTIGVIFGVLPGIGGSAAMALLLPMTLGWHPSTALTMMGTIFFSSSFGGSITSILINTPGDTSNAATMMDGYPMTQQGRGAEAIGISSTCVLVGGVVGWTLLSFSAPLIANFATRFGPPENTVLAILALSIIAALVMNSPLKGLISAAMGLFISTIGFDSITGFPRYVFGVFSLYEGIPFMPAVIGMFALSQVITLGMEGVAICPVTELKGKLTTGVKIFFQYPSTIFRSLIIGIIIGALPAAGRTTASFMAYADAVRASKNPESFGKGNPQGVLAPELANNACAMGDFIPTLALGIPGSAGCAVFLGIMLLHGVVPGPRAFIDNGQTLYALLTSLFLSTVVLFIFGVTGSKYFARISLVQNEIVVPLILIFSLLGAFAVRNFFIDVIICCLFGFLGYFMIKYEYGTIPLLLGMVLGDMAEKNFHRALIMSDGHYNIFWSSWIAKILLAMSILSIVWPYAKLVYKKCKPTRPNIYV